jgi:hypothetical protein
MTFLLSCDPILVGLVPGGADEWSPMRKCREVSPITAWVRGAEIDWAWNSAHRDATRAWGSAQALEVDSDLRLIRLHRSPVPEHFHSCFRCRDRSMALPVKPGSRGDASVAPLQESPSCASKLGKPQNVKNAVTSHAVDSHTGPPWDLGPMPYVSVALRKVPIEGFLCIFWMSLLLITTSIYARIHAASTNVFSWGLCRQNSLA